MRYLLGSMMLAAATGALATDAPLSVGTVHNTRDNGWISYECDPVEDDRLTCVMTQVMIRKKLSPSQVEAKYQEAVRGWPEALAKEYKTAPDRIMDGKEMKELCSMASAYVGLLRGSGNGAGLPPEAVASVRTQSAIQKRDNEQQFGAILDSCASKNLDGMRRSTRLALERDARTCTVSTNRFQQTFRPVRNLDGKLTSWTFADTTPQGECGVVQMSRFRPADPDGKTDTIFWQYVAKKAIANPDGSFFLASCKDLDESETLYDWRSKEIALQCDYIEYSPI